MGDPCVPREMRQTQTGREENDACGFTCAAEHRYVTQTSQITQAATQRISSHSGWRGP